MIKLFVKTMNFILTFQTFNYNVTDFNNNNFSKTCYEIMMPGFKKTMED